ncbi:MAG: hypothetical protein JWM07_52 [Candidatus Saccharibacteria bacterium]|jgi:hypothetical protein|nr:hypothetical protein [Candidatus Saccharibacteria bacterium]
MNHPRERQDTYYLSKIYNPVMLYPDGSVGELDQTNVNVDVRLPSRIEGQERIGKMVLPRLAEVALHASLSEYLVGKTGNTLVRTPYRNSWRLNDMPTETLTEYKQWKASENKMSLDDVRELAATKVASQPDRLNQTVPCPNCRNGDHQYACYTCGYARELYAYPLVRYRDEDGVYDVPVDVAGLIHMNPQALTYESEWEIDDNGLMSASRKIIFNAQTIPKEYITGVKSDDVLTIDPVDDLAKNIAFTTDNWAEGKKLATNKRRTIQRHNEVPITYTPDTYLEAAQNHVAVHMYREQKDGKNYNAMIRTLHAAVGQRGLALAYEYKSMGMGDSEARFMSAKRIDDYVVTQRIAGSFIAEMAVEDAVERLAK